MHQQNLFAQERYQYRSKVVKKHITEHVNSGSLRTPSGVYQAQKTISCPLDELSQPYDSYPFALLTRADGFFIIIDRRRPLGKATIFVLKELDLAVNKFNHVVHQYHELHLKDIKDLSAMRLKRR